MRLFHFSEEAGIGHFAPRPVKVPAQRPPGREWLNGPLVWAIDEAHQRLYLFPRECPRILLWKTERSSDADVAQWLGDLPPGFEAVAVVERAWLPRIAASRVFRYELPSSPFEHTGEVGMWVSRTAVSPLAIHGLTHLPTEIAGSKTQLRAVDSLLPYKPVWQSSLHASGIRLRNAAGWGDPGWPHTPAAYSRLDPAQDPCP